MKERRPRRRSEAPPERYDTPLAERKCGGCGWQIPYNETSVHCGHESGKGGRDCLQCRGKAESCINPKRWWKPTGETKSAALAEAKTAPQKEVQASG